jgi:hypothetical protein
MIIGRANLQIAQKNVAQTFVVILPGVNRDVLRVLVEQTHHQT